MTSVNGLRFYFHFTHVWSKEKYTKSFRNIIILTELYNVLTILDSKLSPKASVRTKRSCNILSYNPIQTLWKTALCKLPPPLTLVELEPTILDLGGLGPQGLATDWWLILKVLGWTVNFQDWSPDTQTDMYTYICVDIFPVILLQYR